MSKKFLTVLLCLSLLFSLVACGKEKKEEKPTVTEAEVVKEDKEKEEKEDKEKEDKEKEESTEEKEKADTAEPEYKDTVIIVTEKEPDTLDPRRGNSVFNNIAMNLIYDSLVGQDENENPVPRLAKSWEMVDDTHITFYLRDDVVFSNGNKFDADDVLYSLARTLDDPTSFSTMQWYDPENSVKVDDHTVTLAMKYPYAPVFWVLTGSRCWIGDKETMEEMGEDAHARAPIGTGPYKLENWVAGSEMKFTRNENYWGDEAKTENILLRFIPEPANRVIELETGAADISYYIDGTDRARVQELEGVHVESGISPKYYLVCFNMQHEILSNQNVRNALTYAINVEQLADASFDGQAKGMTGMYPSIFKHFKEYGFFEYNVEKAKEELEAAGYPDGFEIELHILPGSEYQRMAEIVQAYWAEIGVVANIEQSELGTREAQGPWEASIRTATANEISNVLIIYEQAFASRIGSNDDVLEEMLQNLKRLYDDGDRKVQLEEIQDYLRDHKYAIPFAEVDTIYGVSDKVQNFKFTHQIAYLNVPEWQVEK